MLEIVQTITELGLPLAVGVFSIIALIYVYRDAKQERKARQEVMDDQNDKWMSLYSINIEESKNLREEIANNRVVLEGLKTLIENLFKIQAGK